MKKLSVILISLTFWGCTTTKKVNHELVINNVTIIDVKTGEKLNNRHVAIDGKKISEIYEGKIETSEGTEVIDGTGKYLIPGLSDMHTHYYWNYTYTNPLLIANGITHIREMWGDISTIKNIREQSLSGQILAPDVFSAGSIVDGNPPVWPTSTGVSTPEEAIKVVNEQVDSGVDFIKVYSRLTKENYLAIANQAKLRGVSFAGHIPSGVSAWEAMEAGQKSSEHFYGMLEASTSDPEGLKEVMNKSPFSMETTNFLVDHFDEQKFDSLASVMAKSDTWFSPTLTVLRSIANLNNKEFIDDPRLAYLPSFMTATWDPSNDFRFRGRTQEFYDAGLKKYKLQLSLMGKLANAGVKIIAGTDYPNPYCFPGFSLHDELALMVEGGMTTLQALQSATINPAIFTEKEADFGTIEPNKLASLVLLDADPLENISNTKKISTVVLRGSGLSKSQLSEMLENAKETASNQE